MTEFQLPIEDDISKVFGSGGEDEGFSKKWKDICNLSAMLQDLGVANGIT